MILSDIGEDHLKALEEFVLNHPQGNFFQSPQLYNFYKSLPGYKPELFISVNDTGEINGSLLAVVQKEKGFLKGLLSRRCIVIGGPLIKDNNEELADKLLHELINKVKEKSIYIEFRNLFDLSFCKEVFRKKRFEYIAHLNFIVKILSIEENFKKLDKRKKWQINKSKKYNSRSTGNQCHVPAGCTDSPRYVTGGCRKYLIAYGYDYKAYRFVNTEFAFLYHVLPPLSVSSRLSSDIQSLGLSP